MKHARTDYQDRIIDQLGEIPEDEPVFLLRAKDILAPEIVRSWAEAYAMHRDADAYVMQMAKEHADAMAQYAAEHYNRGQLPTIPDEAIPTPKFPPRGVQKADALK